MAKRTAAITGKGTTLGYAAIGGYSAEVQTVTITGTPAGGTFTLSFGGQTTSAIAYNAIGSTVQTDLQALSTIGSGNVTVSGSAGGPFVITFSSTLAGAAQPIVTADSALLTGGSTPAATPSRTTAGGAAAASGGYTLLLEIKDVKGTSRKREKYDATNYQSPGNTLEKLPGWIDGGTVPFEANYLHVDAATYETILGSDVPYLFQITYPDFHGETFPAFLESHGTELPNKGVCMIKGALEVVGAITRF